MLCEHGNIAPCVECDTESLKAAHEKLRKDADRVVFITKHPATGEIKRNKHQVKDYFFGVWPYLLGPIIVFVTMTIAYFALELSPYRPEGNQEAVPTPTNQPVYLVVKCPNQTITYRVTDDLKLNRL